MPELLPSVVSGDFLVCLRDSVPHLDPSALPSVSPCSFLCTRSLGGTVFRVGERGTRQPQDYFNNEAAQAPHSFMHSGQTAFSMVSLPHLWHTALLDSKGPEDEGEPEMFKINLIFIICVSNVHVYGMCMCM